MGLAVSHNPHEVGHIQNYAYRTPPELQCEWHSNPGAVYICSSFVVSLISQLSQSQLQYCRLIYIDHDYVFKLPRVIVDVVSVSLYSVTKDVLINFFQKHCMTNSLALIVDRFVIKEPLTQIYMIIFIKRFVLL